MSELHEISLRERIFLNLVSSMEAANINQVQLADKLGISKGTVNNWARGNNSPDVDMVPKICKVLGISVLDLYAPTKFESNDVKETRKAPSLSDEAQKVAVRYSKLDRYGQAAVQAVMGEEEARVKEQAEMEESFTQPDPKIIPLFWSAAAAGSASPILGDDYDHYELKPEDPQGAMFAIKVQGDSMEPYFPDGDIAFCNKDPIADGEIGVFCLDGESFIKQYHHDRFMGMTYLFSLNRDRADADKLIVRSSGQYLACLGRVITRRRYPLPDQRV